VSGTTGGAELIAPDDGGRALALVLGAAGTAQIAVAPIHWERFVEASAGGRQQFFRAFSRAATGTPDAGPSFVRRLAELPPAQRRDDIVAHVRQTVLKVLGLSATHTLGLRRPLTEMGLDSLMAVELRNALSASFGATLPASLPFDYPTVEELSDHLAGLMEPSVPPSAAAPARRDVGASGAEDLLARLPELPDSDVDALLRGLSSRPEEGR
jgi:acyl carrier protein